MERTTIDAGWLRLRPFTRADAPWVYQVSVDPAMQRFVSLPSPYRMAHAEFFVERLAIAGWDSGQRAEFLAEDATTGERLGRAGLGLSADGAAEIGYWVDPQVRGRGVATDAVRAVCGWAFNALGLSLIEWRAEVGNTASRRVVEKVGFRIEATLRRRLVHRGERSTPGLARCYPARSGKWKAAWSTTAAGRVRTRPAAANRDSAGHRRRRQTQSKSSPRKPRRRLCR